MALTDDIVANAWEQLSGAIVEHQGVPLGTRASCGPFSHRLNYSQVFTRDFAVSAIPFLIRGEFDIVRNFLTTLSDLQSNEDHLDSFVPVPGLMPASFAVHEEDGIIPDFGERAIGRVAPVDSGLWWLIILHAYIKASGDKEFLANESIQHSIHLTVRTMLSPQFDMFPTMLVPDGAYLIDRRMGVYGYPLDIQALLYTALRAANNLIIAQDGDREAVLQRLGHLTYHLREFYWLDLKRLAEINRYSVEQYGAQVVNKFNVYPGSMPHWIMDWMPSEGGYFLGNLGPGRIDYRFFGQGNLLTVICALADEERAQGLMDLFECRWDDLVGSMPLKVCWPALDGEEWRIVTGSDLKNSAWSYHNGGSWPFLIWLFAAAALITDRRELAVKALDLAAQRVLADNWPEYYDGKLGRLIGKEARTHQTWTIAGLLTAHEFLQKPEHVNLVRWEQDPEIEERAQRIGEERRRAESAESHSLD